MGAAEGVALEALVVDAHRRRLALRVAVEVGERADDLRDDADVGERDRVAVAEAAGLLLFREMAVDPRARAHGPVREPAIARRLVLAHLLLEVVADARRDEGMPVR